MGQDQAILTYRANPINSVTVGRGPVPRHASILSKNVHGLCATGVFVWIERSRGTGPRATVKPILCRAKSPDFDMFEISPVCDQAIANYRIGNVFAAPASERTLKAVGGLFFSRHAGPNGPEEGSCLRADALKWCKRRCSCPVGRRSISFPVGAV